MKKVLTLVTLMATACLGLMSPAYAEVIMFELDAFTSFDLTDFFTQISGIQLIDGVTALNVDGINGDDWLVLEGDGEIVFIDTTGFTEIFRLSETEFRGLLSLDIGQGHCSVVSSMNNNQDLLLYYDQNYGDWYHLNLASGAASLYTEHTMTEPFYCGFSYMLPEDFGFLARNTAGYWWFEQFPDRNPVDLDLVPLFGGNPEHITEFELSWSGGNLEILMAVIPGGTPGTPTPTPGPGTPTATPTPGPGTPTATPTGGGPDYSVLIVNALERTIDRLQSRDYSRQAAIANTATAPNQIVEHNGELFVVNSQSNSITVYDRNSVTLKREMSVGGSKNPFMLTFVDNDHFYVTEFFAHTVDRIHAATGELVNTIELPDDLPADPGDSTSPCPQGITFADGIAYVACANLNNSYVAGGPGIIVRINTSNDQIIDWVESGGRDCINITRDPHRPDWLWVTNAGDHSPGSGFDENGTVAIWSISNGSITDTIPVADAPYEMAFSVERAYFSSAADGYVGRIDLNGLQLMTPVELPNAGQGLNYVSGLSMASDGRLWVLEFNHDQMYTIDTNGGDALVHSMTVGDGPDAVIVLE